jgi:hypothetical protein
MLANCCPIGKIVCDECPYLTTGGCSYELNVAYTITQEESDKLWERRRNELLSLPKETLVEMIMGRKGIYC